ncbi:helix-turn-helix transcriptional regulator [Desulfosporosinus sp. Sb-LF]|uniref:helix-turn-helix domain-containing protein n=1 Tax=Desulfosporosinus sp. Sb-LF TaxID=2560027 RepID=UPI00107F76C5|nr:helix-turn-helix transcriptional regulator [Desulfosporosinus sp. Sb-LF]TGE31457.1 XRE family transcriptional regulator [Desulfosporosinus sp. Sb-LF]
MSERFGKFVELKRKEKEINLRKLAEILKIAPAYMSDMEKGRRYPPDKEKLYKIAEALCLSEEETNEMFDLAALEKENTVSPDLPEYIMGNEKLRFALRKARDINADDADWQKIIEMLENKE